MNLWLIIQCHLKNKSLDGSPLIHWSCCKDDHAGAFSHLYNINKTQHDGVMRPQQWGHVFQLALQECQLSHRKIAWVIFELVTFRGQIKQCALESPWPTRCYCLPTTPVCASSAPVFSTLQANTSMMPAYTIFSGRNLFAFRNSMMGWGALRCSG